MAQNRHTKKSANFQNYRKNRGEGSLYRSGRIWWVAFEIDGKIFRESTETEFKAEAEAFLEQRRIEYNIFPKKREYILYVMQRGNHGPIKIGISNNVTTRLKELQTGNAEKLKILYIFRMRDVERSIHAELTFKTRLSGEWFPENMIPHVLRFFNIAADKQKRRLWEMPSQSNFF